jgi:hypothetical protein
MTVPDEIVSRSQRLQADKAERFSVSTFNYSYGTGHNLLISSMAAFGHITGISRYIKSGNYQYPAHGPGCTDPYTGSR